MRSTFLFFRRVLPWCLALLAAGCTDPYLPDVISSPPGYLVVDGFLNAQGVTTIKLSRTYAVGSKSVAPAETRAIVYIEDEAGTRLPLSEGSVKGTYTSAAQTLSLTRKYRLHLSTPAGKEYASDFVPVKTTPPIDAVNWQVESTGLNVYVDAHDATNATQYYRWETTETWEITPAYAPVVEYVNNSTMRDIVVPYPTLCWGNAPSTAVLISKTTSLSQDVVSNFRVKVLPPGTERLYTRYSILVQQHALTKEEYAYWELLRKNTESIGSLFDPQPAQLTGNVHCLNSPAEVALGFVGAHSVTEKRIFIRRAELPRTWPMVSGYESCVPPDTVFIDRPNPPLPNPAVILNAAFNAQSGRFPIDRVYAPHSTVIIGYTAQTKDCIDCRTRGASVKPSFWP